MFYFLPPPPQGFKVPVAKYEWDVCPVDHKSVETLIMDRFQVDGNSWAIP